MLVLIQIDFSLAFDNVNHSGLLFKLRDVGVGGVALDVTSGLMSSRIQRIVVDGVRNGDVSMVTGVAQSGALGPLL